MAVLELNNVTKRFGTVTALNDVSFSVQKGSIFGFLGPNGAGKTTTIRIILDLIRPNSGDVRVFGKDIQNSSVEIRRKIGYLSGDIKMDEHLTGHQYITYMSNLYGNVKQRTIDILLDRLDCDPSKKIKYLSRGNMQKIGLITALMHEPELLILDEPTTGLDPLIQAEFNEIIQEHAARGNTAFISSHILSEVQSICKDVAFIREGKLIDITSMQSIRTSGLKKISVTSSNTKSLQILQKLKGVTAAIIHGQTLNAQYEGDVGSLIAQLSAMKLTDINIQDTDLEDFFMHHYTAKEHRHA